MSRVWLLSVEIAGRRLYLSSDPASPVAALASEEWDAGAVIEHAPVLAVPDVSWRAIPGSATVGDFSASISFLLPADLSLAELEARGQNVERAPCELSVWTVGTSYEARIVVARGWLAVDSYPLGGETLDGSIVTAEPTSTASIPAVDEEVSDANLNPYTLAAGGTVGFSMPEDVVGSVYPFPIGRPGFVVDETGVSADVPSGPAILITQAVTLERVLISARQVEATGITLYNDDAEGIAAPTYAGTIEYIYDQRGQILGSVDVTAAGAWRLDGTEALFCMGWVGGVKLDNGQRIRGLGDAILYLLRLAEADGTYDLARWDAARTALNTIEIGGYVEANSLPWTIITDDLLPLFPRCVVLPGPNGLYPVIFDETPPEESVLLVEGIDFDLAEGVRPEPATDGAVSAVRLEYAYNAAKEAYIASVSFGPRTDDQSESGHESARRMWGWSQGLGSGREAKIIESPWLWKHDSAARVADDVLKLGCERLPSLVLSMLDPDRWRVLPPGLSVRVTAPTVGWSARPCWVCGGSMAALDEIEVLARPR